MYYGYAVLFSLARQPYFKPTMSSSDNVPLPQSSPVLVVSDRLANFAIQSHDSSPVSQDPPQNCSDSRSFIMYCRSQLLFLVKSPLVRLPYGMPALRDWFGSVLTSTFPPSSSNLLTMISRTENDQSGSKEGSETPLPVGNSQDRRCVVWYPS